MTTPDIVLRAVTVFTTPAGTGKSSGKGPTRPGLHLPRWPESEHWGIIVQTEQDFKNQDGLCIELDVGNGGMIFPKRTQWRNRRIEDNATPNWFKFSKDQTFTEWSDDEIAQCGIYIWTSCFVKVLTYL